MRDRLEIRDSFESRESRGKSTDKSMAGQMAREKKQQEGDNGGNEERARSMRDRFERSRDQFEIDSRSMEAKARWRERKRLRGGDGK